MYKLTQRYVSGVRHEPEIHELAIVSPSGTKVWTLEVGGTVRNMAFGIVEAEKWMDEHIRGGRNHPKDVELDASEVERYVRLNRRDYGDGDEDLFVAHSRWAEALVALGGATNHAEAMSKIRMGALT